MRLQLLDGHLELLAGLVPLVDAREQVLFVHLAPHDQVVAGQVVQLLAGAVRPVLQVQDQLLQVLLLQVPGLHRLLPLLQDHLAVGVLLCHLLDLGLEG